MNMEASLRSTVAHIQPRYTLGAVRMDLNNKATSGRTHVIVEGYDDYAFYTRFTGSNVIVYASIKEGGKTGGRAYTLRVVEEVLSWGRTNRIIGIVDVDFCKYKPFHREPKHVFHTDRRDMETTVLALEHVRKDMDTIHRDAERHLAEIMKVAFHLGQLRIYNNVLDLGCDFRNVSKVSSFVSERGILNPDWKHTVDALFKRELERFKPKKQNRRFDGLKKKVVRILMLMNCLKRESPYDICQGHDLIALLSQKLVKNEFHPDPLWKKISGLYSDDDFRHSHLCQKVNQWASRAHVQVWKPGIALFSL